MSNNKKTKGHAARKPLGESGPQPPKSERIYFFFGKDQTPQQMADTVNKAMGFPVDSGEPAGDHATD